MPVIGISVKQLNKILNKKLSSQVLSDTLEQLGCDLEGIAQAILYECPKCSNFLDKLEHEDAPKRCTFCDFEQEVPFKSVEQDQVIRLDLLPARPDFFDAGGLARALKGYLDIETGLPNYEVSNSKIEVTVDSSLGNKESYRPFIACAVVRMPAIDSLLLRTMMKLQENLHWGIGRDRKLASIGIYDLDTITPPINYMAVKPDGLKFHPLGRPEELMTPSEILEKHPKGTAYAELLKELKAYPLLIDSNKRVLSMPPIINSDETRLKIGSKNLFIDVTGITYGDVQKSLKTLVTSLIELGGKVESVKIVNDAKEVFTPDLTPGEISINLESARQWLGLDLSNEEAVKYLERMRFSVKGEAPDYKVGYPAFRTDMKHEVDVFEDLAIAYGFHKMPMQLVPTMTVSKERPEEKISNLVRSIMLGLGFDEIFSLMLTTHNNHFTKLRRPVGEDYALLLNPKSAEHNVLRSHLLTGLLESLEKNRMHPMPQKYFELGNIVLMDPDSESNTKEERRIAFAMVDETIGYDKARSITDAILHETGLTGKYAVQKDPAFIEGRTAKITLSNGLEAYLGEVHPQVLRNFNLEYPVILGEIALGTV